MKIFKILFAPILFLFKLLTPKAMKAKPDEVTDLEDPVAEAGKPVPVVFGKITVKGLNNLWFGDKHTRTHTVK